MKKAVLFVMLLFAAAATEAVAQRRDWTGQVNFGLPMAQGALSDATGNRYSWGFGAEYSPVEAAWGIRLDAQTSRFRITDEDLIEAFDGTDGNARTWQFALSGTVGTDKRNSVRFYGLAGITYGNIYGNVTEPTLVSGCWWDPWWGYICGSGPANEILVEADRWDLGARGGAGVSFLLGRSTRLFVEGVYNSLFTGGTDENDPSNRSRENAKWFELVAGFRF
jgi:hypothetical protein